MGGGGIKEEEGPMRETPSSEHLVYGAVLECDMGEDLSYLYIDGQKYGNNVTVNGIPQAIVTDTIPQKNIGPFGKCECCADCKDLIGNYTYRIFGGVKVTSTSLDLEWTNPIPEKERIHNKQIITMNSYITCSHGGTIFPITTGQDGELYFWYVYNVLIPMTYNEIMQFELWWMINVDMPNAWNDQIYGNSPYISSEDWMTGSQRAQMSGSSEFDFIAGSQSSMAGGGCEIDWPSRPHTNGTEGHWDTIVNKANELAESGEYTQIYVNKGLHNEVPDTAINRRPDIMGVRTDGKIDQFEVPSRTDTVQGLTNRMIDNQGMLGDRAGSIEVVPIKPD